MGEGNGNPLQYSCLENPVDRGAWWAAVHGILQARILEWVASSFPRGSSQPRDQTQFSCIAGIRFILCVRIRYLSFSFGLTSLCIIGSRFIHLIRTDSNLFLFWMSNVPLCICTTTSLSIHLSMGIYVASMFWLL